MKEATIVGIDLAKNVFQLHGADKAGKRLWVKKLSRKQVLPFFANLPQCTVAMEACGGSHFWGRKLAAMGHEVKMISPQFVKPFVKSNKNDRNDAEAIVEACSRPSMRFVAIKTADQQDTLCLHRVRTRLVAARTALSNEIRGLLGEFGVVIAQGSAKLRNELVKEIEDDANELSARARKLFLKLYEELTELDERIVQMDREVKSLSQSSENCKRMMQVPGVGPITATALEASVGNARNFRNGREMSAWLGLVPRQHSSGGKEKLGAISKRGDQYLRTLLIHGARSAIVQIDRRTDNQAAWVRELVERRGMNRAVVALANKNARVLWSIMAFGENYQIA